MDRCRVQGAVPLSYSCMLRKARPDSCFRGEIHVFSHISHLDVELGLLQQHRGQEGLYSGCNMVLGQVCLVYSKLSKDFQRTPLHVFHVR
jgi:hypothetical protein